LLDGARTVEMRPPLDPAVLTTKAPTRGLPVPWGLAGIWEHCDGFLLVESSREFFGFDKTEPVASTDNGFGQPGALWTGRGPEGERYATTVGNWLGLPADRLLSAAPGQNLADALLLGRTADVWAHWIRQDEAL
jgi:hypothetical protein